MHSIRFIRHQLSSLATPWPARDLKRLVADLAYAELQGPVDRAQALQRCCQRVAAAHALFWTQRGQLPQEPAIFVSNHMGYVDPLVLCSLLACSPIAKREVAAWPAIGAVCERLNVTFLQRDDALSGARVLLRARRLLASGVNVLNFPEGTTTRGDVRPFKAGIFGLARRLGVPVVPIALTFSEPDLCWVDDQTFLPHYLRFCMQRPHHVTLRVGPAMYSARAEAPEAFAARARNWIVEQRKPATEAKRWQSASTLTAPNSESDLDWGDGSIAAE